MFVNSLFFIHLQHSCHNGITKQENFRLNLICNNKFCLLVTVSSAAAASAAAASWFADR